MTVETDAERIKEIFIEQLEFDESLWYPELTFEELGTDSMDAIELLVALEQNFDIELDDDSFFACQTVGEVVDIVLSALESQR